MWSLFHKNEHPVTHSPMNMRLFFAQVSALPTPQETVFLIPMAWVIPNPAKTTNKPSWPMRGCALVQAKLWLNVVFTEVYGWRQNKQKKTKKSIEIIRPLASTKAHQQ